MLAVRPCRTSVPSGNFVDGGGGDSGVGEDVGIGPDCLFFRRPFGTADLWTDRLHILKRFFFQGGSKQLRMTRSAKSQIHGNKIG